MAQEYTVDGFPREEEIYPCYAPRVFTYLLCHASTCQDVQDLLIEVFIAVLEKLPLLDADGLLLEASVQIVLLSLLCLDRYLHFHSFGLS